MSAEYVWVPRDALRELVERAREDRRRVFHEDGWCMQSEKEMWREFEALVEALGVEEL